MKQFLEEFGEWLRYKIRVIVIKQWKIPKTIYRNLSYLNWKHKNGFSHEEIFKVANSRLGWYKRSGMNEYDHIGVRPYEIIIKKSEQMLKGVKRKYNMKKLQIGMC